MESLIRHRDIRKDDDLVLHAFERMHRSKGIASAALPRRSHNMAGGLQLTCRARFTVAERQERDLRSAVPTLLEFPKPLSQRRKLLIGAAIESDVKILMTSPMTKVTRVDRSIDTTQTDGGIPDDLIVPAVL